MLVNLRPTDRLRKGNGEVVQSVLGSILHAVGDESLDLEKLRIVCDWVQYKNSFRDAVEIRPILNGRATERLEIGVDLRRASGAGRDVRRRDDARAGAPQRARPALPRTVEPDDGEPHLELQRSVLEGAGIVGGRIGPPLRAGTAGRRERCAQRRRGARPDRAAVRDLGRPGRTARAARSAARPRDRRR